MSEWEIDPLTSAAWGRRWAHKTLTNMLGSGEKAQLWLDAQNFHLNGVPSELIKTLDGLREVVNYLRWFRGY